MPLWGSCPAWLTSTEASSWGLKSPRLEGRGEGSSSFSHHHCPPPPAPTQRSMNEADRGPHRDGWGGSASDPLRTSPGGTWPLSHQHPRGLAFDKEPLECKRNLPSSSSARPGSKCRAPPSPFPAAEAPAFLPKRSPERVMTCPGSHSRAGLEPWGPPPPMERPRASEGMGCESLSPVPLFPVQAVLS